MIHKYEMNGRHIVLDTASGAIHVVDRLIYDMLDWVKPPFSAGQMEKTADRLGGSYSRDECRN